MASTSPGAIHKPFCNGPNPAQTSLERSSCRWRCHDSGSEKPISVHLSSSASLTTPLCQMRRSPSLSTSVLVGVRPKYMRRPERCRRSSPRRTIRVSVERVASSEIPTLPKASMKLREETQIPRPYTWSPRKVRITD
ncbi:hypothetical protein GCM10020220_016610 [Nonomuraea rubra]